MLRPLDDDWEGSGEDRQLTTEVTKRATRSVVGMMLDRMLCLLGMMNNYSVMLALYIGSVHGGGGKGDVCGNDKHRDKGPAEM